MDPESPLSRVERTLWTVWCYITEAVNRFIRPQPADTVNDDPNSCQETAADIKHTPSDSADGDSSRGGVEEEQLVATSSLLSSSQPVVEWELCTTEIDRGLGVDEQSVQYKTQLRKIDESEEDGESKREEQPGKTGNDRSNDSRAKEDERQMMEIEKMHTRAGLAAPGNDERERAATGPQKFSEVSICQERTEEETDAEKETVRLGLPDDHPTKEENMKETQVKEEKDQTHDKEKEDFEAEDTEGKEEDDDELHRVDEQELEAVNAAVKACIATGISPEDVDHMHKGKAEVQQHNAVLLDDHSGREELLKETPLKEENDKADHEEEQDLKAEATEVTEEYNNVHCEDEQDLEAENNEFKVCITKSPKEEDYVHEGEGEVQKFDAVTPDHHQRQDEIIKEFQIKEADATLHHEEEQDLEADTEINVRIIKDLRPEDEAHTYEGEAEVQKNDAGTLDEHPREDEITKETQLEEEDDKMQHEDEQHFEAEDTEVQLCITTDISPVLDDDMQETEAELQKTDTATLDDHPEQSEILIETQQKKEDDKGHRKEEQDLEPETVEAAEDDDKTDTEVKVCIRTDISPEDEAAVQKNDVMTLEDHPMTDNIIKETELKEDDGKMQHRDEEGLEAEACDAMLQLDSEKSEEKTSQVENQLSAFGDLPDTSVGTFTVIRKPYAMTHISENDEGENEKEVETEQPAANETTEVPELDENMGTEGEDTEGENLLTEYDSSGTEAAQKTTSQLHTAGFTDKYEEDVRSPGVQAKTRQTNVTVTGISAEERLIDRDQGKEESISEEAYTREFDKEIIHSSPSVTVRPKGETTQEMDEEFKNTPPGISEGQCAVLQELNTPTCEEIQEGVSKYNNELRGADENTTQRFLEAGDCEEIPATQLPEEVESGDQESLENTGCRTGADYLLLKESMEEKQERKEETETSFGLFVEEHEGTPDLEPEAERLFFDKEEGKLLKSSMKTEVTGTHAGLVDETERRSEELHDGGRGSYFSKEASATGGDCETREAVAAADVVGFVIQESVDAIKLDQSISRPSSLQEGTSKYGFVRPEIVPKSLNDSSVEMQDKATEKEGRGREDEEEEAGDGIQTTNEMDLQITKETAGELITERGGKESPLNAELELSQHHETQETKNQSPHRALEISETQIIVAETADGGAPEDLPVMSSEGKGSSASGHQDVIDEEILDLWIETAMSEDTDEIKQEETEPGQLLDAKTDRLNEERVEISTENEKVSLAESICRESEAVSDTEMSSSTVESGFLKQSLSESCIQSSGTQLLNSTITDSLQGNHGLMASVSTDIFGVFSQPQTQDLLTEESAETAKGSVADIEAQSDLNQESQEKGEGRAETLETESRSQKAYEDVEEEADVTTLTIQSAPSHIKKAVAEEEEHLEVTASDSSDVLKPTESEDSESDSQSEPEKDTLNLSSLDRPQPAHSSLLPVPNEARVAEESTIKSEDKVDGRVLDFAMQRSRIAVKNPRVRPPKNPRSLLHMPSEEPTPTPTPTPSSRLPVKLPGGVPLGGMGIGIKLPGLGAGFPVLKKTQQAMKDENTQETVSQEPETKPEEKSDALPQEDEAPKKPKWMPPKHPGGFGNPLMAELKTKLKKTPKE